MRTTVAIVEVQPDTVGEDYRRVLKLSGVARILAGQAPTVMLGSGGPGFRPGWDAAPWQLDAALDQLATGPDPLAVVAVGDGGPGAVPGDNIWQDTLARHGACSAAADFLREHHHTSSLLHPALDTVLPRGVWVPVGLAERPALLLAAPAVQPVWGVRAAGALLKSLVMAGAERGARVGVKRRAPAAEVFAEAVGVARELLPVLGVVVDGAAWGVSEGRAGAGCVVRNIVLAGTDPVAVDAVAMRLAGVDQGQVPWLRICHERGFGRVLSSEIRLVGRTDLLTLDFGLAGGTFAAHDRRRYLAPAGPLGRWLGRLERGGPVSGIEGTAWGRLRAAYESETAPLGDGATIQD